MTDSAARGAPPKPAAEPAEAAAVDANVAQSVQAATQALDHLEQSLHASGFPEGTSAYERMADVLLAQWVSQGATNGQRPVDFERLGTIAGRIFGILHPYAVVMRRLAALAPDDGERARAGVPAESDEHRRRTPSRSASARPRPARAARTQRGRR